VLVSELHQGRVGEENKQEQGTYCVGHGVFGF
jgi:hypothetical protein